jgi:hypothetical protein
VRIRTVKPEFFVHEGLFEAESEAKLPLRLAFIGLWCAADREGRFKWEPRRLGVQIMPYDHIDFSRVLDALTTRGFVRRYALDSREFGCIPTFARHQVINNREKESELPEPPPLKDSDACPTRAPRVDDAGKAEGKGREQGKEGNGKDRNRKGTEKGCEFCELPFLSEAFKSAWTDWVAFRREIKKPVTPTMAKAQLRQLGSLNERRAIAMIEHTIGKGWQGLREQDGAAEMYPEQQERSEEIGEEDLAERLRLNRERRIAQEVEAQGRAPEVVDDGMEELF